MQNKIQILSTKKLLPSIIELGRKKNMDIIEKEFISIKPILTKELNEQIISLILNSKIPAIVFTSANAVNIIKKYLHQSDTWYLPDCNVFCLEGKTKNALYPYFKTEKIIASGKNASELAQNIIDFGIKKIIFFCGNKRRNELPDILKNAGINVQEIILYETVETPDISDTDLDGILFFSPSAVKSFFSINKLLNKTICFAIGNTTASEIEKYTTNKTIVSPSPNQEMMLETICFYFANINCYE